jgi:hypothetical protein
MDMIGLENSFGISSLIGAVGILFGVKGAKPHSFTTFLVGAGLITVAATTASTFSNLEVIAKWLHFHHRLSDSALDDSLRVNDLWVLIYPALVGALGVNLLTAWFQSSNSETKEDSIEMSLIRLIGAQRAGDAGDNSRNEQQAHAVTRRPRKNVRPRLIRKR